ncbi:MAG: hypothetical protein Q8868_02555 [Bacteroidota bacterium]|nr:hypothetical protein [Bacteroidota bacterium]
MKQLFSLHKISVSGFAIILFSTASAGQSWLLPAGAAETGMNHSCIMKSGFWSAFQNQALLPHYQSFACGINYENRFSISELATRSVAVIVPAGKAGLGAFYRHFGYHDLRRHTAGIACGLKLSEKISAGVQIDYLAERTYGEYDERESLTFEVGIYSMLTDKIRLGMHLYNPVPGSIRKNYLPSSIRAGAGILLSRSLFAGAEVEMRTGMEPLIRMGIEYEAIKDFRIRGGFSSENTSFSLGIGYVMKLIRIDLGFATHELLGVTSSASIIFKIK